MFAPSGSRQEITIGLLLIVASFSPRKTRDELSHNIFLMLQECNKFREYQARENLIELLETQLAERRKLINELLVNIESADALLQRKDYVT